jgi:hypothetical protein
LFKLFSAFLMNVCASTAFNRPLVSTFKMKLKFHHLLWYDWEICHLCGYRSKMSTKAEAILCILCVPVNIFETHIAQNLW